MRFFKNSYILGLFLALALFTGLERVSSQTPTPSPEDAKTKPSSSDKNKTPTFDELSNAYPAAGEKIVITDYSSHFAMKWLRRDFRVADVVAHVNVVGRKLIDHTEGADCDNDRGNGYCAYLLTAEVKEVFKGNIQKGKFEFIASSDADYPKKGFMGEKVEFLVLGEEQPGKKRYLGTMENSTRWMEHNILERMRSVVDPDAPIDENDENEPYSFTAIRKSFDEAAVVAYVDVQSFRPDRDHLFERGSIVKAVVLEVFKGDVKSGQILEYKEDLVHRSLRPEDVRKQVVYLSKVNSLVPPRTIIETDKATGKAVSRKVENLENDVIYQNEEYTEGFIKHGIIEKLRRIARTSVISR